MMLLFATERLYAVKALVTNTLANAVRTIFDRCVMVKNRSYGVRKGICDQGLKYSFVIKYHLERDQLYLKGWHFVRP